LSIFVIQMPVAPVMMFLVGVFLLVAGMGLFSLGSDLVFFTFGRDMGASVMRSKKAAVVLLFVFVMGFSVTVPEPNLAILAVQIQGIDEMAVIPFVSVGAGLFLVLGILRYALKIRLSYMLIVLYALVFVVSLFIPDNFLPAAFDIGGVITGGTLAAPFVLSFGLGIVSMFRRSGLEDDGFGFIALCGIGSVLAFMVFGMMYHPAETLYFSEALPETHTMLDVAAAFVHRLPTYIWAVLITAVPVLVLFAGYQLITKRYGKVRFCRIFFGFVYIICGLILFLTGLNVGFVRVGSLLGAELVRSGLSWLLIPVGMFIGGFVVLTEPAVQVINKQIEETSGGSIPRKTMKTVLSVSAAAALGLAMLRMITGAPIYFFIIPGYALALALTFFTPRIFTGIAFDSGGIAAGPMTSAFVLPIMIGACRALGGDILKDAFGVVAMVALSPLITIQIMGIIYRKKAGDAYASEPDVVEEAELIINFDNPEDSDEWEFTAIGNYFDDDRR